MGFRSRILMLGFTALFLAAGCTDSGPGQEESESPKILYPNPASAAKESELTDHIVPEPEFPFDYPLDDQAYASVFCVDIPLNLPYS